MLAVTRAPQVTKKPVPSRYGFSLDTTSECNDDNDERYSLSAVRSVADGSLSVESVSPIVLGSRSIWHG